MAKKSGLLNVYTGLLAGVVGGWYLNSLSKKTKTTAVVGTDNTDYDQGWSAAQTVAANSNGGALDALDPSFTASYRLGWDDYRFKRTYGSSLL